MKTMTLSLVILLDFIFPLWCFLFFRKHIEEIHTKWILNTCLFLNQFLGFLLIIHYGNLFVTLFVPSTPAFITYNLLSVCNLIGFICILFTGAVIFPNTIWKESD